MTRKELAKQLLKENIVALEFENANGDTIELFYFNEIEIADIEDYGKGYTIRLQKVE